MEFLSREEYHKKKGKKVYGKDDCPFCDFTEKIVWEGTYWIIIHNLSPYSGDHKHLMAVPKRHIKFSIELNKSEILEFKEIQLFVKDFFGESDYFSFTRETIGNRSVEHLHIHFLVGKLQGKFLRKMLELQGFPIKQKLEF